MRKLSNFNIKLIAIFSMTIDHIGAILLSGNSALVCRCLGRLAFPIFCFLLVEGYYHTKNIKKYMIRLAILAFVSEPIYDIAFYGSIPYWGNQNVFFELFWGLLAISLIDSQANKFKNSLTYREQFSCCLISLCYIALVSVITLMINADYHIMGIAIVVAFYVFHNRPICRCIALIIIVLCYILVGGAQITLFSLFSLIPISLYNGERGYNLKYGFYLYYPLHLFLLTALVITPLSGVGIITSENYRAAVKPENNDLSGQTTYELSIGTPDLVNDIIVGGGLQDGASWSDDTSSLLLEPIVGSSQRFEYPDIFLSNNCFALLCKNGGEGWELKSGDTVKCTFCIDIDNMDKYYQEYGGVRMRFYPIQDGICDAEKSISDRAETFAFSYTATSDGIYYFGLCNRSSDKALVNHLELLLQ